MQKNSKKHRSDISPDPGGHRPQRPCAQGRTCAKQDQAHASAPGQNRTQFTSGATTHGLRTRQAGKSVPTQTRPGWRVHTADCTPRRNTATRSKHLSFMCQGDIRPRAAAGSSRNGTTQAVAATTGIRLVGNASSNTASAWSDPEHTRKRSSRRRGRCYRAVQARDTLAFKQQMFNVAPSVFPSRWSPRSRNKVRTQGEDVILAETTRCGNSCDPKVKTVIPNKVGRAQGHYWVHNRR